MLFVLPLLAFQASPIVLHPRIVEIAVYKPGLVYVNREASIPKGTGLFRLDHIPQALDGSLWYRTFEGAKVSEIRTTLDLDSKTSQVDVTSIASLLTENAGAKVALVVRTGAQKEAVSGKLLRFDSSKNEATLKLGNGNLRSVSLDSIVECSTAGLKTKQRLLSPQIDLRFRVASERPSRIQFVSLETGAAWVANYRLDVKGNRGNLESSAALGLGSIALKEAHVRLISGLPTLAGAKKLDLVTGGTSLSAYLSSGSPISLERETDPYEILTKWMQQSSGGGGYPDGLFRGGRGQVDSITYSRDVNGVSRDRMPFVVTNTPEFPQFQGDLAATRLEDLHVYDFGPVSLPAGGRLSRVLSNAETPLKTVYRWDVTPSTDIGAFMRTLRVRNEGKTSWPAGGVFVVSEGVPLAQIAFPFTPSGQEASLVLGAAEDILRQYEVQEVARKEISPRPNVRTAEVTYDAVLTATNTRSEPVDIEVGLEVGGEVVDAGGSTAVRLGIAGASTPTTRFTWKATLAAGEKKVFTARYRSNLMN